MDKNFFKQVRILDGGMGQELLARGLNPKGTLWSAKALLEKKNHSLVEAIHEDFVKEGADVIGSMILVTAGDSVIIEKDEAHTIETSGNAVGSMISSPR